MPSFRYAGRRMPAGGAFPPADPALSPRNCHCEPVTDVTGVAIRFSFRRPAPTSVLLRRGDLWSPADGPLVCVVHGAMRASRPTRAPPCAPRRRGASRSARPIRADVPSPSVGAPSASLRPCGRPPICGCSRSDEHRSATLVRDLSERCSALRERSFDSGFASAQDDTAPTLSPIGKGGIAPALQAVCKMSTA